MIKCIVIGNFRGTCASVKILKGYMLICWNAEGYMLIFRNAEGVHGKRKVGNPWYRQCLPVVSRVSKYSENSLCYHHQNTLKPCFMTISVFTKNRCGLSKWLCGQQGKIFQKSAFRKK